MYDIVSPYETPSNLYCPVTYIYKHVEPDAPEKVRYVGKSNDPDDRLKQHIAHSTNQSKNTHHGQWITSLLKRGLKPTMIIIEVVDFSMWEEREVYWIDWHLQHGHDLTNTYFGGKGVGMIPLETRLKMGEQRKGRKHRPESIEKLIASKTGMKYKPMSEESQRNISKAHEGITHPPEFGEKVAASKKGKKRKPFSEEWRRNLGNANRGKKQSPEHIANKANAKRGKKVSPEGCANISAGIKRAKAMKKKPPEQPTLWD